ncbi:MAG: zinc ribbon domain-containing protein [bacterium]
MITIFIFILLAAVVSYLVVSPIFKARIQQGYWGKHDSNHRAGDLVERKETIYAAIKDIEFDYQMGKLSEEDFKELRQQYKDEAIGLLKKIDKIQGKKVKAKQLHAKNNKKADARPIKYCWICGTPVTKGDQFCVNCGTTLE